MKKEIRLEKWSDYPVQYTAFAGHVAVGYLRIKHGQFTVTCPDAGGHQAYEAWVGDGDSFAQHSEVHYLTEAKLAIVSWMAQNGVKWPTD